MNEYCPLIGLQYPMWRDSSWTLSSLDPCGSGLAHKTTTLVYLTSNLVRPPCRIACCSTAKSYCCVDGLPT